MLILSVLFMFGVGFFIMGKLDDFLNENIRELEEKLGYKLFVNLPKKISEEQVEKVKTQDPSKVAVWK